MKVDNQIDATLSEKQDIVEGVRKMLSFRQVLSMIPLSRTTLDKKIREGSFPSPYPLTAMKHGFFHDEVVEGQKKLVEQNR